ncbi:MAG: hypothetical protein ACLVD5_16855 [Bilophila wadsworthia]
MHRFKFRLTCRAKDALFMHRAIMSSMDQVLLLCPRPLISLYVSIWASPLDLWYPRPRFRAWTGGSRAAGSWQGDAIRELSGRIDLSRMGSAYTSEASPSTGVLQIEKDALPGLLTSNGASEFWMWGKASFSASRVAPTAEENRPLNIALPVVLYLGIHA